MDSARSWFQKFQPRDKTPAGEKSKSPTNKNDAGNGELGKPPTNDEAPSDVTKQKVAAAKQYIENHYKTQMKSLQERKER
jgi:serine/threonine kinase 38